MNVAEYSERYNTFARMLLQKSIQQNRGDNIILSPLSILVLLAIAADATAGETKKEITELICDKFAFEDVYNMLGELQKKMTADDAVSMFGGICGGCAPILQFKEVFLDRPFVFAIIHDETGIPIFTGIVNHMDFLADTEA